MTKHDRIITALRRDIQGCSDAAQRKRLDPNTVQIVIVLKQALARELAKTARA